MSVYAGKFSALDSSLQKKSQEPQPEGFNAYLEQDVQHLQKKINGILDTRRSRAKEIRQLAEQIESQQIVISVMQKFAFKDSVNANDRVVRDSEAKTSELREELAALKKKLNLTDRFKRTLEENQILRERLEKKIEFCAQFPVEENTRLEGLLNTKTVVDEVISECFKELDELEDLQDADSMDETQEESVDEASEESHNLQKELLDSEPEYVQEIVNW